MLGGMPIASSDARSLQRKAVSATAPTDQQVMAWLAATSLWTPTTLAGLPGGVTVLSLKSTPTGNVGGGEDTLWTYNLPADSLSNDGDQLKFLMWGLLSLGAGTRTIKVKFGATNVLNLGLTFATADYWRIMCTVIRTGATAQIAFSEFLGNQAGSALQLATAPAETLSGAVTLAVTRQSSLAADNDVVLSALILERYRNTP